MQIKGSGGGGGGCFLKDTEILRRGGLTTPIQSLRPGDRILSFNEKGEIEEDIVEKVLRHEEPQPVYQYRFWNGFVFATPNHWVLNQYSSFVPISSLTIDDAFVDGMGHLRPLISTEFIGSFEVYNLVV